MEASKTVAAYNITFHLWKLKLFYCILKCLFLRKRSKLESVNAVSTERWLPLGFRHTHYSTYTYIAWKTGM